MDTQTKERQRSCDVTVVGGGLGGLAAATLLARRGLEVEVLERASAPGGRAATRERGGFFFNEGAHALYRGGAAARADGARLVSDGGGEFRAALRPVLGPDRITRFFLGLTKKLGAPVRFEVKSLNGLPALMMEYDRPDGPWAKRFVVRCDVDAAGAIHAVHIVVASAKLARVAGMSDAHAPVLV